jgi:hypothetical protein
MAWAFSGIHFPAFLPHLFYCRWLKPTAIKEDAPSNRGYLGIHRTKYIKQLPNFSTAENSYSNPTIILFFSVQSPLIPIIFAP